MPCSFRSQRPLDPDRLVPKLKLLLVLHLNHIHPPLPFTSWSNKRDYMKENTNKNTLTNININIRNLLENGNKYLINQGPWRFPLFLYMTTNTPLLPLNTYMEPSTAVLTRCGHTTSNRRLAASAETAERAGLVLGSIFVSLLSSGDRIGSAGLERLEKSADGDRCR